MNKSFDCIVIGAGISGITASIYLKRWNFNVLLLEKSMPGGVINKTSMIENYPGILNMSGSNFALDLYKQIEKQQIQYQYADVLEIQKIDTGFQIFSDTDTFFCKSIILATGRTPRLLGLNYEQELLGNGISNCATCDGPLYKNQEVCVIGGGNSALEESLYLSSICKKLTIIHHSNTLRADDDIQEKIKKRENINILYNTVVKKFQKENQQLKGIEIETKNETTMIPCKCLFIYIGSDPIYPNIQNLRTDNQYIIVDEKMQTNIPGICACGDVIKKDLYQLITAASEGAIAANTIKKYLKALSYDK